MMKATLAGWGIVLAALCVFSACSKKSDTHARKLTAAQRDSAIAASDLPGAKTVGKALAISDSAKARANQPVPQP